MVGKILALALAAALVACEKPNLEDTGGGYGRRVTAPVDTAAPGVAGGMTAASADTTAP